MLMFVLEETYLHFTQSQSVLKGISFSSGWILYHVSHLQLTIMPFLLPVLLLFTQGSDCRRLPQHTKTLVCHNKKIGMRKKPVFVYGNERMQI